MNKIELQVIALNSSESSAGNYSLVLKEVKGERRIAIIIGPAEAQSIAIHMERMQLSRPLSHDLLKNTIALLNARVKEVLIHDVIEGVYHAKITLLTVTNELKYLDARVSDALALAVRVDCLVCIYENLLEEQNLISSARTSFIKGSLSEYTLEELKILLENVLAKEDYESATRIRDFIKKRNAQ